MKTTRAGILALMANGVEVEDTELETVAEAGPESEAPAEEPAPEESEQ